ncbi:hypothetical protein C5O27_02675 [Gordonia alkanivorans]|uniref:hypothetical protein n=1 Tax=Gordonia alkanivorans TaxID=84096 RepID=UPI000FDDBF99|nr:hypothetical protein [Gordonia alkanivorans]AZZ80133.1 hypothetical protein C5O27_02675 [Gordonia alkanivorans]
MLTTSDDLPQWWSEYDAIDDLTLPEGVWNAAVEAAFDDAREVDYALYEKPELSSQDAADMEQDADRWESPPGPASSDCSTFRESLFDSPDVADDEDDDGWPERADGYEF